ncbi:MAG: hypothetical protein PsegKO_27190 [Pseudohongiellaceae bacterium]
MSRKILVSALLLMIAAASLAPWWVGGEVRSALLDNMLYLMPDDLRRQIEVTELDYQRGWFSSQARYQIAPSAPVSGADAPLLVELDIAHGPWLRGPGGRFPGLAAIRVQPRLQEPAIQDALRELSISLPELIADLRVGLDQRMDLSLAMAPLEISEATGELRFAGLEGYLIANADLSAEGFINVGQITATGAGSSFVMEGLEIETRTQQINDLLAPSFAMLAVPAIRSTQVNGFSANNIQASTRLSTTPDASDQQDDLSDELLDIEQHITIAELQSSLPLQSLDWLLEIRQVPVSVLRSYSSMATDLQEQLNRNGGTFDAQVNTLAQRLGLELLHSPLRINNQIAFGAYQGEHQFSLALDYQGMPELANIASLDLQALIAALTMNLDLDLDLQAILRSPFAGMIDTYVQEGYIVVDSGRVHLQGSLADSHLQLNGETIPIEQFF